MEAVMTKRNGTPPPLPEPVPVTEVCFVRIGYMSDGKINIQAPIHDKVVCYGLLEAAKVAIAATVNSPILTP